MASNMDKALGITQRLMSNLPKEEVDPKRDVAPINLDDIDKNLDQDYKLARENMHEILSSSSDVMEVLKDISMSSEQPRFFEVYANMINSLVTANKELVDLSVKQKERHAPKGDEGPKGNITNNTFIGTTDDLLKMLKGDDEPDIKDVTPNAD